MVNFSGHCFMTIKLERHHTTRWSRKKGEKTVLLQNVAQKSINWINKSIFGSCKIESHFYRHEETQWKSCIKIRQSSVKENTFACRHFFTTLDTVHWSFWHKSIGLWAAWGETVKAQMANAKCLSFSTNIVVTRLTPQKYLYPSVLLNLLTSS